MNRFVPMMLLTLGLGLAAASGARNGDAHLAYRDALWTADHAEDAAAREAAVQVRDQVGLPKPGQRVAEWFARGGLGWGLGVVLIVAGAGMARRQQASGAQEGDEESRASDFCLVVDEIRSRLDTLSVDLEGLPMDAPAIEAREAIDAIQLELIEPLVESRGHLISRHGVAVFAEYFSPFAGGERNLNRCWSALTDGHAVVAREALGNARQAFSDALDAYKRVDASATS
jgi:hypothetical protein